MVGMTLPRRPPQRKLRGQHPHNALTPAFVRNVSRAGRYCDSARHSASQNYVVQHMWALPHAGSGKAIKRGGFAARLVNRFDRTDLTPIKTMPVRRGFFNRHGLERTDPWRRAV